MWSSFYKIYFVKFKSKWIDKLWDRIIVRTTNIFIPAYFLLTGSRHTNKLTHRSITNDSLIVSLTSFPVRIRKVWLTIETILRQSVKPDRIIIWLYRGDFKGKDSLPKRLLRLEKRGLEIRFCDENLMPHLKYFYTMSEYPEAHVVTIDDDMFYPPDLIEKLKHWHEIYPDAIVSSVTRRIYVSNKVIRPYDEWQYLAINTSPSLLNLTMGVGGSFYPKRSLHHDAFDVNKIKRMSLKTDDIWLKVMSLKNNMGVVSIAGEYPRFFIPLIIKNNISLMSNNICQGINVIVLENLLKHFNISASILEKKTM